MEPPELIVANSVSRKEGVRRTLAKLAGACPFRTMASLFSHAVVALSIGTCFYRPQVPKRTWIAGTLCSIVPDLDVIGFHLGVSCGEFWGHRGFTHSLVFAALFAIVVEFVFFCRSVGIGRFALFGYLFLVTASHGLLDAMTDGGLGVAFFSPLDNNRYFLPWRPIRVSPITVSAFFKPRAFGILKSELLWIWVPATLFALAVWTLRGKDEVDVAIPTI